MRLSLRGKRVGDEEDLSEDVADTRQVVSTGDKLERGRECGEWRGRRERGERVEEKGSA